MAEPTSAIYQLVSPTMKEFDGFGLSVAISGALALVGSPNDDVNGDRSGSAHLFDVLTGQSLVTLTPQDGDSSIRGAEFGSSVALCGNIALVGAPGDDFNLGNWSADPEERGDSSGAAYLLNSTTGQQISKLSPDDLAAFDYFGASVALSNNVAVVGSRDGAYVFDATTGQQVTKLTLNRVPNEAVFGAPVALDENIVLIGDPPNSLNITVHVFDVTTGQLISNLIPEDGELSDEFGTSVAISGTTALIGSYRDDDNGDHSGSAYVFNAVTGEQLLKLTPEDGAASQGFGSTVAIQGKTAIVGTQAAGVYVFNAITGRQLFKIDMYAITMRIAVSNQTALIGASNAGFGGSPSGTASFFDLSISPVLFIPGIAGSVLEGPTLITDQGPGLTDVYWPSIFPLYIDALNLKIGSSNIEAVDVWRSEAPDGYDLAPYVAYESEGSDGTRGLLNYLKEDGGLVEFDLQGDRRYLFEMFDAGVAESAETPFLFCFPYDWRKNNSDHLDDLHKYISNIRKLHGGSKINVIAHSMGGLLLRKYVLEGGDDDIAKAVTLNTPFWGSPKGVYRLLTGNFFDGTALGLIDYITRDSMKESLATLPSAAQLLPPFGPNHPSGRQKLLIERGLDLNGRGGGNEIYSPGIFWNYIKSINSSFLKYNATFHSNEMSDWRDDNDSIKWFHFGGDVTKDGINVTANEIIAKQNVYRRGFEFPVAVESIDEATFVPGDGTVPLDSALLGLDRSFRSPNAKIKVIAGGIENAGHLELTQNPEVYNSIAEFFCLEKTAISSKNARRIESISDSFQLRIYGTPYVSITDSQGNKNTRLSEIAALKIPGYKIRYNGIDNWIEIISNDQSCLTLEASPETGPIEAELIGLNSDGNKVELQKFRFSPMDQSWKIVAASNEAILQVDANRNGTYEDSEIVPPFFRSDDEVDTEAPVVTVKMELANGNAVTTISASDASPGSSIYYQIDDFPLESYSTPFEIKFPSNKTLRIFAEDSSGNASSLVETFLNPRLDISRLNGGEFLLEWPSADLFILEESRELSGNWAESGEVVTQGDFQNSNRVQVSGTDRTFYRLRLTGWNFDVPSEN